MTDTLLAPEFNRAPHSVPKVIGVWGYATAGKDTVGEIITRLYGHQRVSFADAMKQFARKIDPIVFFQDKDAVRVAEWVDGVGDTEAKKHPEYRRLLQQIGTRARETFGDDIWVDAAWKPLDLTDGGYVFTDVRFKNEARSIVAEGGKILKVVRPGVVAVSDHISEIDLEDWPFDGVVNNDGDLTDLEGEVQRVLGEFGRKNVLLPISREIITFSG